MHTDWTREVVVPLLVYGESAGLFILAILSWCAWEDYSLEGY